ASEMMRRILVTHAIAKKTDKRGGEFIHLELDEAISFSQNNAVDFVDLDEALVELEKFAPRQAKVVEMRFFGGLTIEEVAKTMNLDERTIKRDWRSAKAWLFERLKNEG
ncbi:MAG TPA: ECF-type sigma factor, partial [Pyrinomonadaceae bacterium]|nr:ECF-type sigma factor [Pyrinomonadaceae bacterium]